VVVFHDENGNGTIDHSLLGPSEPIGFSGVFALGVLAGFPSFGKLKFQFKPPAQTLEIVLRLSASAPGRPHFPKAGVVRFDRLASREFC